LGIRSEDRLWALGELEEKEGVQHIGKFGEIIWPAASKIFMSFYAIAPSMIR